MKRVRRNEVVGVEVYDLGYGFALVSPGTDGNRSDTYEADLNTFELGSEGWFITLADLQRWGYVLFFLGHRVSVDLTTSTIALKVEEWTPDVEAFLDNASEVCEGLDLAKIRAELG